jgi:LruC domain-containing protein
MKRKLLTLICGIAILTASCKKDNTTIEAPTESALTDLVVPTTFNWQTSRDVNFSIGISDTRFQNRLYVIGVFLADPATGATAISKGAASLVSPFNAKISVPANVDGVFILKTAPDGSSITQYVALTSQTVSLSLGATATNNITLPSAQSATIENVKLTSLTNAQSTFNTTPTTAITEPGCAITSTGTSVTSSSTKVTCYTATANTTLNVAGTNGGTLKINAPGKVITIGTFTHTKLTIFVGAGTTVIFPATFVLTDGEAIVNNGVITGVNYNSAGDLYNNGTATFTGTFNISATGSVTNASVLVVKDARVEGALTNTKSFVATTLTTISGAGLYNECNTDINGTLTINSGSIVTNNSLITADNTVIAAGTLYLYDGAMYQTTAFSTNTGLVYATGAPSLFKVVTSVGDAALNSGAFWGSVQYCGKELKASFGYGAVQACGLYLPKDDCNTLGNGAAPAPIKPDTDGDGIFDEQDAYPNDKTKAFDNYSVNYSNGGSTVAFEDSWPSQGDYDLNDVVLTYKHQVITNASNIVVRVQGEWNLIATGGDYQNGAGIQFPILKSSITNFSSSSGLPIEAGQDSLVVPLFTNSRALQSTWNTINGQAVSPTKTFTFSFDVTSGPTFAAMGVSSYNPFIWNNTSGFGRGYETHLYGRKPTQLATATLFGTKADNSKTGKYYSTVANLPWGIEIPVADFKYPVEYKPVTVAYLKFGTWASSGGTLDKDWYSTTGVVFRNIDNLFAGK